MAKRPAMQMTRNTAQLLEEGYDRAAARLLDGLIDFMSAAHATYGDIERLLILAIVAQRAYSDPGFARQALGSDPRGSETVSPLATNIMSIAKAASLPRETVRRKVNELAASGLIKRSGTRITLTQKGVDKLSPARRALITFSARQHDVVARLAGRADPGLAARRAA